MFLHSLTKGKNMRTILLIMVLMSAMPVFALSDAEKLQLGGLGGVALNSTYTCTYPNCTELSHIIKNGCPNETAEVVEARKLGSIMSTTVQYIKDNPASIAP